MTKFLRPFVWVCCGVLLATLSVLLTSVFWKHVPIEICAQLPEGSERDQCVSEVVLQYNEPRLCELQSTSSGSCAGLEQTKQQSVQLCQTAYEAQEDALARNTCFAGVKGDSDEQVCLPLKTDEEVYQQCLFARALFRLPPTEDMEEWTWCHKSPTWRRASCQLMWIKAAGTVEMCGKLGSLVDPFYGRETEECYGYFAEKNGATVCDALAQSDRDTCLAYMESYIDYSGNRELCAAIGFDSEPCQCLAEPPLTQPKQPSSGVVQSTFPLDDPDARYVISRGGPNFENWQGEGGYNLLYLKNNELVGSVLIDKSSPWMIAGNWNSSAIEYALGTDVLVTGTFSEKTYSQMIYCTQAGPGCGPFVETLQVLSIESLTRVKPNFSLEDPVATYTILFHPTLNHAQYLVYDNGTDVPTWVLLSPETSQLDDRFPFHGQYCQPVEFMGGEFFCHVEQEGQTNGKTICLDQPYLRIDPSLIQSVAGFED